MNSAERVVAALKGRRVDKIPWCELSFSTEVASPYLKDEELTQKNIARFFGLDNICYGCCPPAFAERGTARDGRTFLKDGLVKTRKDLKVLDALPNPYNDKFYEPAYDFVRNKEDFAACAVTDLGAAVAIETMGFEGFSYALQDDPDLVHEVFNRYTDWSRVAHEKLIEIGFDFIWSGGDLAFNTSTMFSPQVFREFILPKLKKVADVITIPWIYHSDGNLNAILEDLLTLGMDALHPLEPDAMDIFEVKQKYGDKICVIGNVSVDTLARGSEGEVKEQVRNLIEKLSHGGRYIISSSNSIPNYAKPANVKAMAEAIAEFGVLS